MVVALFLMAAPPIVVVRETDVMRRVPPPRGAIGMSTAYRISDVVRQPCSMEIRRRVLDVGAAIGAQSIDHDAVNYVLWVRGEVVSDGGAAILEPGMAA
jgi:hypothetical protein